MAAVLGVLGVIGILGVLGKFHKTPITPKIPNPSPFRLPLALSSFLFALSSCVLVPRVSHLDLFVELLGGVVQAFEAGRTTNSELRLNVAHAVAATDAGGQETEAGIARVVELCAAVFATNLVSSSHSCKF